MILKTFRAQVPAHVLEIVDRVWEQRDLFVSWPMDSLLLLPGTIRDPYHTYPKEIEAKLKAANVRKDTRSNGPAISSFLLAGGVRPKRSVENRDWSVHHIYDGKFPAPGKTTTTHAVKDGRYFSESAGLVAIHPIADALADEVAYFAWLLRCEAFVRFAFDPDAVFCA
jgi:hypothetical protein